MKRIESKEDMVKWAREVNSGLTQKAKCDYQDIWAHSSRVDIDRFFIEANGDRKIIVCSVYNTMAYEEVEHLLTVLAKHKANKIIDKEIEEYNKVYDTRSYELLVREKAFSDCRKSYWKRIKSLRVKSEHLTTRTSWLESEVEEKREVIRRLQGEVLQHKTKARKFDELQSLLS